MDYWINWEQLGIVHLPSFVLGTIAIVLLPGPNSLYVLTTASQSGWRPGVWASLGIVAGDSVLILAVSFLFLAIILQVISITYLTSLILAGQGLVGIFRRHPRWTATLWFVVGLLFCAFAVRLVLSDQVVF
ncbi:MAG: hypothetical protein EBY19_02110 [Burkholderiaceae bacterium]|nr:hypothetical protein [Burkholderiaceae bacterium]